LEADLLLAKRDLESAKEKIGSVKRHEQEKQQNFAAKAKETIETLKDRLAKAESAQHDASVDENVLAELTDLMKAIRDKDERIKKLEKTKITKSQIANIQKLKVSAARRLLFIWVNHVDSYLRAALFHRMNGLNSWPRRKSTNSVWKNWRVEFLVVLDCQNGLTQASINRKRLRNYKTI
jgi:hypothetical protein